MERATNIFRIVNDERRKLSYYTDRTVENIITPLLTELRTRGYDISPKDVGSRRGIWYIYRKKEIIGEVDGVNLWLQSYDKGLSDFAEKYSPQ